MYDDQLGTSRKSTISRFFVRTPKQNKKVGIEIYSNYCFRSEKLKFTYRVIYPWRPRVYMLREDVIRIQV